MASQGRKVSLVRRVRRVCKATAVCQENTLSVCKGSVASGGNAERQALQAKGDRPENVESRGLREVKVRLVLRGFGVFKEIRVLKGMPESKALRDFKEREEKRVKKAKKVNKDRKGKKATKGRKASAVYKVRQVTAAKMV
jgi:hypothetical protein